MAKENLFKAILGIGGAVAAVLVTRKDSRNK
ncbi:TPA: YtxH domain-containing protein, partial [Staphylococcus aureus]|nr:YtxH domain-containing protein [Staphylococcus aureus]